MDTLQSTYGDSEASEPTPTPPPEDAVAEEPQPEPFPQPSPSEPQPEPILEEKPTPLSDQPTPKQAPPTKRKKKSKDVWSTTSRKKPKKTKNPSSARARQANAQNTPDNAANPNHVLLTPIAKFPDKHDDSPELPILLSKSHKAEKVELTEDRLSASSSKGYRMVRATRGVTEGAWYFEVKIVRLGESGHTRLGWSTDKGDLQAPVGYDMHGYGYRDVDGSKVHKALREAYGDGYGENDVIGFYVKLPDGEKYAPEMPRLVWYKGQRYVCGNSGEGKEETKMVPGSEISFFKNGVCQGVSFTDLCGGRYYPAASMYTLPNQPSCVVKFNFGPDFEKFPEDFGDRPIPKPMSEVPYQVYDTKVENGVSDEKKQ